jgi:outer membrane receptor for ferrienterochelin and colicins
MRPAWQLAPVRAVAAFTASLRMLVLRNVIVPGVAAMIVFAAVLAAPAGLQAQTMDYAGMEQLMGEPVTMSVTGAPQRATDVPANMDIITAEDIRRSGADNIPDILQFVAGLDIRRYGFAAADIGVRGYTETSNPRLLVLVNGQQVYMDDIGRTQWYTLPVQLAEIRQIEIVKGPSSALYGFNAASGVINIITYDPLQESVNTMSAAAGTQGYTALSGVGTWQIGDIVGIRATADGFHAREYDGASLQPADTAFQDSPERAAATLDATIRLALGVALTAAGAIVNTRIWEATGAPFFGTDFQRTNWSRLGITADEPIGLLSILGYRNELRFDDHAADEFSDLHDQVYVLQASDLVKLGAESTVRLGVDYRDNLASSSHILAGVVGYQVFSASGMWDWRISPTVSFTNAVRYDFLALNQHGRLVDDTGLTSAAYNNRRIGEGSFNSGLVWTVTQQDTLRLLAARGLQLPSLYDLGSQDLVIAGPVRYLFYGNPDITAAAVTNLELDWDRMLPALRAKFRFSTFVQRTDNVISNPYEAQVTERAPSFGAAEEFQAVSANVGDSTAAGAEAELRGILTSGVRWNASYTFETIHDRLAINQAGLYSPQDYERGTPSHSVVLGAGYTWPKWELDGEARWQSSFLDFRGSYTSPMLTPVIIGNYIVLNARAAYAVSPRITVALTTQQFNTSHITEAGAPPIERRVFLTLSAHL